MKELKCKSCGGTIEISDDKAFGKCPYCGTFYKLNDDLNININLDNNLKDMLGSNELQKKGFKIIITVCIIVFVFVFSWIIFNTHVNDINENFDNVIDESAGMISEYEIKSFNSSFEIYSGTLSDFFVEGLLDKIVTSNKTHDRQITLVYGDIATTDYNVIIDIKHNLESGDYEVMFDYDDVGFISKISLIKLD